MISTRKDKSYNWIYLLQSGLAPVQTIHAENAGLRWRIGRKLKVAGTPFKPAARRGLRPATLTVSTAQYIRTAALLCYSSLRLPRCY